MLKILRTALICASLCLASQAAMALDLPVKRINGKDYYYYKTIRGETLLSIAEKLGVTREDILRSNPSASDGIRPGSNIYLPVSEFAENDKRKAGVSAAGGTLRYKVERGETLFGIAYRFGVTPDQIVALNPAANSGVHAGDILFIPASGAKASESRQPERETAEPVKKADKTPEIPSAAATPVETTHQECVEEPVEEIVEVDATAPDTAVVAVLMPLMLEGDSNTKQARSAADFMRGFMLGVKSLSSASSPVDLRIYDTGGSLAEIKNIVDRPELLAADVVIAPEEPGALGETLAALQGRDTYVMNLFSAQDTSYLVNPHSIQTYIPAALMYEKAAEELMRAYEDYRPVFLIAKGGRSEKIAFTDRMRELYAQAGVEPLEIAFDGMLTTDDLAQLDRTGRYVFIPASGSLSEFNKFARPLVNLRDEFADPSSVGLIGYPDWTAFLGEARERLHTLGATIYSRFYNNELSADTRRFEAEFQQQYGQKPLEQQVPSQAQLGYDTARYLLSNAKANGGLFTPEDHTPYRGLQSTFMFVTADEEDTSDDVRTTGPVNQALYIIRFLPGEQVNIDVI